MVDDPLMSLNKRDLVNLVRQEQQAKQIDRLFYKNLVTIPGIVLIGLIGVLLAGWMDFPPGSTGKLARPNRRGDCNCTCPTAAETADQMSNETIQKRRQENIIAEMCSLTIEDYNHVKTRRSGSFFTDDNGLVFPRTFYEALGLDKGPASFQHPTTGGSGLGEDAQQQDPHDLHIAKVFGAALEDNFFTRNTATSALYRMIVVLQDPELRAFYNKVFAASLPAEDEQKRSFMGANWMMGKADGGPSSGTKKEARVEWLQSICGGPIAGSDTLW